MLTAAGPPNNRWSTTTILERVDSLALQLLDVLGVFVFASLGALVVVRKEMDVFGIFVLAFLPALGGGALRDFILGVPVFWVSGVTYIAVVATAVVVVFFGYRLAKDGNQLFSWMDTLGLAVFSVLGCQKALAVSVNGLVAVIMGVITAPTSPRIAGSERKIVANVNATTHCQRHPTHVLLIIRPTLPPQRLLRDAVTG